MGEGCGGGERKREEQRNMYNPIINKKRIQKIKKT